MSRKSLIIAAITFALSCLALKGIFSVLKEREMKHDKDEIKIVHDAIKEQFKLVLHLPSFLATGGARNFADGDFQRQAYSSHAPAIIAENKDIIGLNIIDDSGKIVRVYPEERNKHALGNITQNLEELRKSFYQGHREWLSPPFKLYQGEKGFAFYSPIVSSEKKLRGWFATVIGGNEFFDKFRLANVLRTYELTIRDRETGEAYFESAIDKGTVGLESEVQIKNRSLIFKCWRKKEFEVADYPWYVCILISLFCAGIAGYINHLKEQRRKSRRQLKDLRMLLQMTSKEALNSLIDLRTDKQIYEKELSYLNNLVEQIDLLQTMTDPENRVKAQHYELLPLVQKQLADFADAIEKKNLTILFDYQKMSLLSVLVNERLVQHGLIHHVLFHLIVHTEENSSIEIFQRELASSYELHFHAHKIMGPEAFRPDRRFEVARKVMDLCGGDLTIENSDAKGMLIKLIFPVKLKINRR